MIFSSTFILLCVLFEINVENNFLNLPAQLDNRVEKRRTKKNNKKSINVALIISHVSMTFACIMSSTNEIYHEWNKVKIASLKHTNTFHFIIPIFTVVFVLLFFSVSLGEIILFYRLNARWNVLIKRHRTNFDEHREIFGFWLSTTIEYFFIYCFVYLFYRCCYTYKSCFCILNYRLKR